MDLTPREQWERTRRAAQKQLRRSFGYTLGRVVEFQQREKEMRELVEILLTENSPSA